MSQSVSLFIGLRYMRGRATDKFGRFVSSLSAVGIALGVTALITMTSVMNGFERLQQESILTYMPHVVLTSASGYISPKKYPMTDLKHLKGVNYIIPIVQSDVVLQSRSNIGVGMMLGLTSEERSPLLENLVSGQRTDLIAGEYRVFLSQNLAENLELKRGDEVRLIIPGISQLTPMGRIPSQRLFTVAGIFKTNSKKTNSNELVVEQTDAAKMMRYPQGNITGWQLFLEKPLKVDELSQQKLPDGLIWKDWREYKGEFFQAVKMEKNLIGLLLSLIIAVAAFNIITSLSLLVMEKSAEVAILKTLGLNRWRILVIFMIQGAGAGIIGSFVGVLLGIFLSCQLDVLMPLFGLLPKGEQLPIQLDFSGILTIAISAMLISLLATLYPSWRAAIVKPVEALRYE